MKIHIRKWVECMAPDQQTGKVAVRTLRVRLERVEYYLKRAAKKADKDVEYVHNLRIWTRRATAALKLYDEMLPSKQAAWFRKWLKRIRHAAADARDYDMLAESLKQDSANLIIEPCLKRLSNMREEAQKPLIAIYKRLQHKNCFNRRIKKLLHHVQQDSKNKIPPFRQWAHAKLQPIVRSFFEAVPDKAANLEALHQFRIRGKELRYATELLAGAFSPDFRRELYPVIETIQDRLGRINDLATACTRLQQLLEDTDDTLERKHLLDILKQKQAELERAPSEFLNW